MIYAPERVDGTRRFRFAGAAARTFRPAPVPLRATARETAAALVEVVYPSRVSTAPQSTALVVSAGRRNDDGGYALRAAEDTRRWLALSGGHPVSAPSASGMVAPNLFSKLRPAGATRWMLPPIGAITPMYLEGVLRGALAGNHVQAWEVFDLMIDTDPEIAACVGEYIDGVTSKKLLVRPYADEGEQPTDTAKQKAMLVSACLRNMRPDMADDENDFRATLKDVLFARFFGQSVLEIDWWKKDGSGVNVKRIGALGDVIVPRCTYWVHPVCYAWNMTGRLGLRAALESDLNKVMGGKRVGGNLSNNVSDKTRQDVIEPSAWNWMTAQARPSQVLDFPANKFLIGVDKFKSGTVMGSGSCLRSLAWWWLASVYGWDYMLQYAQLFGIPFRTATVAPGTSPDKIEQVKQLMASMGSTGYAVMNTGENLEFERAMGGAGESPQAFLAHFANDQKRKVILRQTMSGGTAGGGSKGVGKSFGETEAEGSKEQLMSAGAAYAESVINLQFVPYILNLNYGEDGDLEAPTIMLVDEDVGGLKEAQVLQILVANGLPVGVDHAYKTFSIEKPTDDEKLLAPPAKPAGGGFPGAEQGAEGGEGSDEAGGEEAAEARAALAARLALPHAKRSAKVKAPLSAASVASAAAGVVSPLVSRLKAIDAIEDEEVKKAALAKMLKDIPAIAKAIQKDPSLAEAVASAATLKGESQ